MYLLAGSPQEEKHCFSIGMSQHGSESLSVPRGAMIQCHIAAPKQERFYKEVIQSGEVLSSSL